MVFGNDGETLARAEAPDVYSRPTMHVRLSARYVLAGRNSGIGRLGERASLAWSTFKGPPKPLGYNAMRELSRIWHQNSDFQVPRLS